MDSFIFMENFWRDRLYKVYKNRWRHFEYGGPMGRDWARAYARLCICELRKLRGLKRSLQSHE